MAGLGTVFKDHLCLTVCHGQGTGFTVQNLKARCTNLSWGPGRTSGASDSPAGDPCPALLLRALLSTGLCSFDDEGLVEWMYHPQALETYWLVPHSQSSDRVQQHPYLPAFPMGVAAAGVQKSHCMWAASSMSWTFLTGCMCIDDFVHAEPRAFAWEFPERITKRFGSWAVALWV